MKNQLYQKNGMSILICFIFALIAFLPISSRASSLIGHYYTLTYNGELLLSGSIEDESNDRLKVKIKKVGNGKFGQPEDCVFGGEIKYCIGNEEWVPKPDSAPEGFNVTISD